MEHILHPAHFDDVPLPRRRQHRERGRDPYDGLRPWSAVTHGAGAVLALLGTVVLLLGAKTPGQRISFFIYGLTLLCLYTASTLYHSVNTTVKGRIALRKFDHAAIYFLIAGTYTPICATALRGAWGWSLLAIIWALAIGGLFMSLLWINCPRSVTAAVYIAMGWLAIVAIFPLWQAVGSKGLFWLLLGGVLYTIGGVLYALKWPGRSNPRFGCHEVFHLFILLGSAAHFLLMYRVILPL